MPYNCDCGQKFDLVAALDALPSGHLGSSGMFCPVCAGCGRSIELRLKNSGFEVGYSYFGGSMHFEAVKRVSVKGLKITPSDPDDLDVAIGSRQWHFGMCRPTTARYTVFQQAFANGKRLRELDFGQWDVTLTAVYRNGQQFEHTRETVVEAGDFLCFSGPEPALTRVWQYMNNGVPGKP